MLKKNKVVFGALCTSIFILGVGKAIAECGDSTCADIAGERTCVVERPDKKYEVCTEEQPCRIDCN